MRVLLTGASGQLARAVIAAATAQLRAAPLELIALDRKRLDVAELTACREVVQELRPDWLIHAAAYTAVDRAEQEPALAHTVNAEAPGVLAEALAGFPEARMLQISTDFVFNGREGRPYSPDHPVDPLSVYGSSKAEGERRVLAALGSRAVVLRTSWLYGPDGHNFLNTMLRLHRTRAAAGEALAVVADQVGCPTSTAGLAEACWRVLAVDPCVLPPVLHWSDAGVASWYDFAVAIGELAVASGLLAQAAPVQPITTADYPTPAQRPSYSLLDCRATRAALGLAPQHWRLALAAVINQLVQPRTLQPASFQL